MVDEARLAAAAVDAFEHHRRVAVIPVVVLDDHRHGGMGGHVGAVEAVPRVGRVPELDEPIGMLCHPTAVDAHVVGHHVACQPDAVATRSLLEVGEGWLATEVLGDDVVVQGIGARQCAWLAATLLDAPGRLAALPQADEPQPVEAALGELGERLVGDLIEPADLASEAALQLRQPHVGALGDEHHAAHPVAVGAEGLVLAVLPQAGGVEHGRRPGAAGAPAPLLLEGVDRAHQARQQLRVAIAEQRPPAVPGDAQLTLERGGAGALRSPQQRHQAVVTRGPALLGDPLPLHGPLQQLERPCVATALAQGRVVAQLPESLERGVGVGEPHQQRLLERHLEVGRALGLVPQVGIHGPAAARHHRCREALGEGAELGGRRAAAELVLYLAPGCRHRTRRRPGAVALDERVHELVQQHRREQLAAADRQLGVAIGLPHLVDPPGQCVRVPCVPEQQPATQPEGRRGQVVAAARVRGDMQVPRAARPTRRRGRCLGGHVLAAAHALTLPEPSLCTPARPQDAAPPRRACVPTRIVRSVGA